MSISLDYYWQVIQRRLPGALLLSVGIALVAWFAVRSVGPTYEVHFSYLVALSQRESASEYQFDGYYALSATDLFAGTLAEWLTTPEVVVSAYEHGGVSLPSRDSRALSRLVSADKRSAQLVAITVRSKDQDEAERVAAGLKEAISDNIDRYHQEGIPALRFRAVPTEVWVGVSTLSQPVIATAVFLMVFFLAINLILLRESLRDFSE